MILKLCAGAIIAGAAISAPGCARSNASTPLGNAAATSSTPWPADSVAQNTEDKIARISVENAKKLVAEGKAVIIDVRNAEAYKTSHVKGAPNVPLSKLEAGDFSDLPKDKQIIAYCG